MSEKRNVRIVPKRTAVSGRVPTGTTGEESSFIQQGEIALNTADHKMYSYDGSNIFEIGSNVSNLSAGTISANTISASTLQGNLNWGYITSKPTTISGYGIIDSYTKSEIGIMSANTYNTAVSSAITYANNTFSTQTTNVKNGLNTYTAGTNSNPSINISSATLNALIVTGNTVLANTTASTISTNNIISNGQLNISGSSSVLINTLSLTPTGNTSSQSWLINNSLSASSLTVTGNSIFGSYSSGKINMSNTNVNGISDIWTNDNTTLRITNSGSESVGASLQLKNSASNYLFSFEGRGGFRYWSRNSNSEVFAVSDTGSITSAVNGVFSGGLSANTLSSGNTNLYNIFSTQITNIGNGLNTYTAGTNSNPSVNISSATLNYLTVTGNTNLSIVSATSQYANTYLFNNSLNNIFLGSSIPTGLTSGYDNLLIGSSGAGASLSTGFENIIIGEGAAPNLSIGNRNIILGNDSGSGLTSASDCVLIGVNITPSNISNKLWIGNNTMGTTPLLDGVFSATVPSLTANANLIINSNTSNTSGLKLTNLTSSYSGDQATTTTNLKLSVDASGNVILVSPNAYVNSIAGSTYTLLNGDSGEILRFTSNSTVYVTVPPTLPTGFNTTLIQVGTGQLILSGSSGLYNSLGLFKSRAQYSTLGIMTTNIGENILIGDVTV